MTLVIKAVIAHIVSTPAASPASAWAAAPFRVVCPESSSSHRPASSSPRSKRVLVSRPHTAPRTMSVIEVLNTVKPATVWSWRAGPKSARLALFRAKAFAKCCRSAGVL